MPPGEVRTEEPSDMDTTPPDTSDLAKAAGFAAGDDDGGLTTKNTSRVALITGATSSRTWTGIPTPRSIQRRSLMSRRRTTPPTPTTSASEQKQASADGQRVREGPVLGYTS